MNILAQSLSLIASIFMLAGYLVYCRAIARRQVRANATSWGIWALTSIPVIFLYQDLSEDWVKVLPYYVCAIGAVITFLEAAKLERLRMPDRTDLLVIMLDASVLLYFFLSGDKYSTSIILELDIWITFIPIFRSTWNDPNEEIPRAWGVWTISYALMVMVVALRWDKWWDLILPMNYVLQHGTVWLIARSRRVASNN